MQIVCVLTRTTLVLLDLISFRNGALCLDQFDYDLVRVGPFLFFSCTIRMIS